MARTRRFGRSYRRRSGVRSLGLNYQRRAYRSAQPRLVRRPRLQAIKFHQQDSITLLAQDTIGAYDGAYHAAAAHVLNTVSNNDGQFGRIGSRINCLSVLVRGTINYRHFNGTFPTGYASDTQVSRRCMLVLVQFSSQNSAPPQPSSFLSGTVNPRSFENLDNSTGYRILLRKNYTLTYDPVQGDAATSVYGIGRNSRAEIDWKIPLNVFTTFTPGVSTATTFSEIRRGSLVLYFISALTNGDSQSLKPVFSFNYRLCYNDM